MNWFHCLVCGQQVTLLTDEQTKEVSKQGGIFCEGCMLSWLHKIGIGMRRCSETNCILFLRHRSQRCLLLETMYSVDYTNWKGDRRWRKIIPIQLVFDSTQWHPTPQWLLRGLDLEDCNCVKLFSVKDIHDWKEISGKVRA